MAKKSRGAGDGKKPAKKPKPKPKRGPRGAFLPGNKEGATGRPKGSRNQTTLMIEALLEDEAEALTRALIVRAKKGYAVPLQLVFERLAPARRDRHIQISLPPIKGLEDHASTIILRGLLGEPVRQPEPSISPGPARRMARKNLTPAIAYLRTSSAANVGVDRDSERRQREAIRSFAKHGGFDLVGEYYDAAVSGADPIDTRPGFRELLERIVGNGVRTVIVEDASRFARTLMVQEAGIATLAGIGVQILTSRGDDLTDSDDEMRVAMRQIAGVFSQLEKTRLVKKLRAARDRKRAFGKVEGRKTRQERLAERLKDDPQAQEKELGRLQDAIAMTRRLHRANPVTGKRMSLGRIADELQKADYLNERGQKYHVQSVKRMLGRSK